MSIPSQIDGRIDRSGPIPTSRPDLGPCWLWIGAIGAGGYALATIAQSPVRVHRLTYEDEHGPVPDGLELDHLCEVKSCVRPSHLEPVTHVENTRRHYLGKATCASGHAWTPENTYRRPSTGRRECRSCNREKQRTRRAG